jgi:GNAT superfamily N-acetyltransferase|tara:strand:- start:1425 stop:1769 length:345 start_codon:yes stop_codon:yes gene_type:complete
MSIKYRDIDATGRRFYVERDGVEVARAYLYVLTNDIHNRPFGFVEDVFVDEGLRGQGVGSELVKEIIEEAKRKNCYKLICTSRYLKPRVHELYQELGFKDHGKEFRMDFNAIGN